MKVIDPPKVDFVLLSKGYTQSLIFLSRLTHTVRFNNKKLIY